MAEDRYIVASRVATTGDKHENCLIVKEGDYYPATHAQVYGPETRAQCEQWVARNCRK